MVFLSGKKMQIKSFLLLLFISIFSASCNNLEQPDPVSNYFKNLPESAKPWVFWYWMHGAYSREGITADLEAMRDAGIGGAYLVPIKGITDPPLFEPSINQLSPEWWDILKYTMEEAERCGIRIAMHASDGFATAGGPWITPELSMQKVVWTMKRIKEGEVFDGFMPQPESYDGYYKDIVLYAFPTPCGSDYPEDVVPVVTTSDPRFEGSNLLNEDNEMGFRSREKSWILFAYERPVTCRSIKIFRQGINFQSLRPILEVSDDGLVYHRIGRMEPPRAGWLDWLEDVTYAIKPVTSKYFRFIYDPEGAEPGAEDLDAAKWNQALNLRAIQLSGYPRINQYEGKNGSEWRVGSRTDAIIISDELCIDPDDMINLTDKLGDDNSLNWEPPAGDWTLIRMGYTSTGKENDTGGAGKGLECDKFNPIAVKLQFEKWFEASVKVAGNDLVPEILKIMHVDSWECGSQNWSPVFRDEFSKRRGYDPVNYLPAMAGIPVGTADQSERFLFDIRQTIADLVIDVFYGSMNDLVHEQGCLFSGECVAPVFVSDGMEHYREVDMPMGEFWLRSPSHDKLNDMLDAISGAHIYGKSIIQAEAFTEIRIDWDEYPGMLKALGDRNLALGANRFVNHVFTHNPWLDRKPGMTLDRVGLYFQRNQTWWDQVYGWTGYLSRCQALLQKGLPVTDIAVFTGEELPRRAITPDRLVTSLPGIFGEKFVEAERQRIANEGSPMRELPAGVRTTDNMADPEEWIDLLKGYHYDSFNKDALLRIAETRNGRIVLPGGASYSLLIIPGPRPLNPNPEIMSVEVAAKILELVKEGATVIFVTRPERTPSLAGSEENDRKLLEIVDELFGGEKIRLTDKNGKTLEIIQIGKGRIVSGPYTGSSFETLGLLPDLIAFTEEGIPAGNLAWNHRKDSDTDIYFLSNQSDRERILTVSFKTAGKWPEIADPVKGELYNAKEWKSSGGITTVPLMFPSHGSIFVIFKESTINESVNEGLNWGSFEPVSALWSDWTVSFDKDFGGPDDPLTMDTLYSWTEAEKEGIRYYSGTAVYSCNFQMDQDETERSDYWIDLGKVSCIAEVLLNGHNCGVVWTEPCRLPVTDFLVQGKNSLEVRVSNTWANRLIGDHDKPESEQITWTTAPYRLSGRPLMESGLLGPVRIERATFNE